jgi:hypothetical protein
MVTEMDKLQRAKEYVEKLAKGIDPFTDNELGQDTILSNERLSRCFSYIAGVLRKVMDNGGIVGRGAGEQRPFFITGEELKHVKISEEAIPVSIIVKAVNDAASDPIRKKLSVITVTNWLVKEGYLIAQETEPGKHKKVLTDKSRSIGMSSEQREGSRGTYEIMLYDKNAQRFLLDNMKDILGA